MICFDLKSGKKLCDFCSLYLKLCRGFCSGIRSAFKMMISQRVLFTCTARGSPHLINALAASLNRRCLRPVSTSAFAHESSPSSSSSLSFRPIHQMKVRPMPGCISTTFRQLSTSSSSCSPSKGEDTTTTEDTTVIRCWQCNKVIDSIESPASDQPQSSSSSSISTCTKCGSVQRIAGNVNFFRLFKIAERYDIDLGELRRQYLRLQATMHPDRNVNRSETDTDYSTDNSSLVNTAYRTLRDPYQRALYLLKHRYMITIGEEDTTSTTSSENSSSGNVLDPSVTSEPDLLLEILELNEEIELAAGDAAGLQALSAQLEETIARLVAGLRVAFDENDSGGEARRLVLRFSYYLSALEKVKAASLKA